MPIPEGKSAAAGGLVEGVEVDELDGGGDIESAGVGLRFSDSGTVHPPSNIDATAKTVMNMNPVFISISP